MASTSSSKNKSKSQRSSSRQYQSLGVPRFLLSSASGTQGQAREGASLPHSASARRASRAGTRPAGARASVVAVVAGRMGAYLSALGGGAPPQLTDGGLVRALGENGGDRLEGSAHTAWEAGSAALEAWEASMEALHAYEGNQTLIQKALGAGSDVVAREEAFKGMFPNVHAVKGFFETAGAMDEAVAAVLRELVRRPVAEHPDELLAILVSMLEAVFLFDWAKMSKPAVQNDFSFYRRELAKNANMPDLPVDDSEASSISMFIAHGSPLLTSMQTNLTALSRELTGIPAFLAEFVNGLGVHISQLRKGKSDPEKEQKLILAMVISVALYDRMDPLGAFVRGSNIDMKRAVLTIKKWDSDLQTASLNTLHYSTKTFDKAPSSIKKLFP